MAHSLPDLVELFDALVSPVADAGPRFAAQVIPGFRACAIGKDSANAPALLVEIDAAESRSASVPILLECFSVLHNIECRVQLQNNVPMTRRLSVIRCTATDRVFHEYFLRTLAPVILSLPQFPSRQHLVAAVNTLVSLFSRISQAPRKTIQGLWAELFVISRSSNPSYLIRCWHALPHDRFDFAESNQRVEVKAATNRIRCHHFSLEQLRPPLGSIAIIASILVENSGAGETVLDLLDSIRRSLVDPDLMIRLDGTVAQTLGSDWRHAMSVAFDGQLANESLQFYDVSQIPSVPDGLPPEVSDVRFRVDISQLQSLPADRVRDFGGLVGATSPVLEPDL